MRALLQLRTRAVRERSKSRHPKQFSTGGFATNLAQADDRERSHSAGSRDLRAGRAKLRPPTAKLRRVRQMLRALSQARARDARGRHDRTERKRICRTKS